MPRLRAGADSTGSFRSTIKSQFGSGSSGLLADSAASDSSGLSARRPPSLPTTLALVQRTKKYTSLCYDGAGARVAYITAAKAQNKLDYCHG